MNAVGIAKEEQEKSGQNKQRHADDGAREQPDESSQYQGPEDEGPAGGVDSHMVVSSLLLDEAETETGPGFRGFNTPKTKPGFSGEGQEARKWVLAYSSAICSI